MLHRAEHEVPPGLVEYDFWTVDDSEMVLMHYDAEGHFEAAEVADDPGVYLGTQSIAWAAGESSRSWSPCTSG